MFSFDSIACVLNWASVSCCAWSLMMPCCLCLNIDLVVILPWLNDRCCLSGALVGCLPLAGAGATGAVTGACAGLSGGVVV